MDNLFYYSLDARREHYHGLLSRFEAEALIREELRLKENRAGLLRRLMAWMGSRLVSVGSRLQETYEECAEAMELEEGMRGVYEQR